MSARLAAILSGTLPDPTIAGSAVTNAKLAQMSGNTLKGNNTSGAASAVDLTAAQRRPC